MGKSFNVIKDIDAWTPQIRSRTAIRSGKKHIFVDPSIGIAALDLGPDYFNNDLDLFGHVFENMVLRDLLVYASTHNARALNNLEHPRAIYREPSALIVICATAPMGYTTDTGVKVVQIGCLKD